MSETAPELRIHVVESMDWKDAVISMLEPESPYRPWRHGGEPAEVGESVVMILNTEPRSIATRLGRVGADGDLGHVLFDNSVLRANLLHLATFTLMDGTFDYRGGTVVTGARAESLTRGLNDSQYGFDRIGRFGHSSMAAANILLDSRGRCTGCSLPLDLRGVGARYRVHLRTVDFEASPVYRADDAGPQDWPGVLCSNCHERLRANGFDTLVDYRFASRPQCPSCGARRSRSLSYGLPVRYEDKPPWISMAGCVRTEENWQCAECLHPW